MSERILNFSEFFDKYSKDETGDDQEVGHLTQSSDNFEQGFDDTTYGEDQLGPNRQVTGGDAAAPLEPTDDAGTVETEFDPESAPPDDEDFEDPAADAAEEVPEEEDEEIPEVEEEEEPEQDDDAEDEEGDDNPEKEDDEESEEDEEEVEEGNPEGASANEARLPKLVLGFQDFVNEEYKSFGNNGETSDFDLFEESQEGEESGEAICADCNEPLVEDGDEMTCGCNM